MITLAVVSFAAAAASAYAQYEQAEYQADVARYNRKVATQQADLARQNAAVEAEQIRERGKRIQAANRASVGASGVVGDVGSPLQVMMDNAAEIEYEALLAKAGGQQRAGAYESEARLLRWQTGKIRQTGRVGAGTTLLAGAIQAGGYGYQAYNVPSTTGTGSPGLRARGAY